MKTSISPEKGKKAADSKKEDDNELVLNYLKLRRGLGWMGISLPIALITGAFIWNEGNLESSISNYFHTILRDLFVVTLCSISLFLFVYHGYTKKDRLITNLAAVLGFITAFVHTKYKEDIFLPAYRLMNRETKEIVSLSSLEGGPYKIIPPHQDAFLSVIHLSCAGLFFLTLAYMSYFQFTQSKGEITPEKIKRNRIYKTCALIMVLSIAALIPCFASPELKISYDNYNIVFWAEALALLSFGFSWLVKGEFILKDK